MINKNKARERVIWIVVSDDGACLPGTYNTTSEKRGERCALLGVDDGHDADDGDSRRDRPTRRGVGERERTMCVCVFSYLSLSIQYINGQPHQQQLQLQSRIERSE